MKKLIASIFTVIFAFHISVSAQTQEPKHEIYGDIPDYNETYLSPESVRFANNGTLLVLCRTGCKLLILKDEKLIKSLELPPYPSGLAVSPDKKFAYITTAAPMGKLIKVNIESGKVVKYVNAGHMPRSVDVSPDGTKLFVTNQFENVVRIFDANFLRFITECKAIRDPFACAITPNGKKLFILNQLPESKGGLYEENIAAAVNVYQLASQSNSFQVSELPAIPLPNGSINAQDIIASPDGRFIICTHSVARFNVPTTQVERGWINTNSISIIDAISNKLYATVLIDDIELGAANPYGLALDGKNLIVTHSGSHEISIIDFPALIEKIEADYKRIKESSKVIDEICNDLSYLSGIRKRVKLNGLGPRRICAENGIAYAAMYYSDTIERIDLNTTITTKISIEGNESLNEIRRGDLYYHDASLCFQHWLSCVTCHTEVRSDALNWDLLNDGMGNPKQSKSMLFAHFTAPSMITGVRENANLAVRKGIQFIQFAKRPEEDSVAIDKYLMSLKPVQSPYLKSDGTMSESAERGAIIFEEAGCSRCHSGEHYTDMKKHDVGSGLDEYKNFAFDTPTLCEVWRTAPYLYDGRARTIFDMFKKFNPDDKHGKTSKLSDEDLKDLEAYVLTL